MSVFRIATTVRRCVPVALALVFGTAGCTPTDPADALLQDYAERVERTLTGQTSTAPPIVLEAWPRARTRRLDVPAQRVDLVDFLRLQDCGLGALVGARSSALGRVQRAPERLRYEHAFVRLAEACLAGPMPDDEAALRDLLEDVLAVKRDALPRVAWNATLGSEALALHHGLDARALPTEGTRGLGIAETEALHALADRVRGLDEATDEDWFEPWAVLERSRFGGRLYRSLVLLERRLGGVADLLEEAGSICPLGRPSERARILHTVFDRTYAARVQPWLADVDAAGVAWAEGVEALRATLPVTPPTALVRDPVTAALMRMHAARDRHTRLWQHVLRDCGLAPASRIP